MGSIERSPSLLIQIMVQKRAFPLQLHQVIRQIYINMFIMAHFVVMKVYLIHVIFKETKIIECNNAITQFRDSIKRETNSPKVKCLIP